MRWGDFGRSDNVEDRTGEDPGAGSGGGFPLGGGMRLGGGALVVIVVASLLFGVNPLEMIGMLEGGGAPPAVPSAGPQPGYGPQRTPGPPPPRAANAPQDPAKDFVSAVLRDTENVWETVFKTMGAHYEAPRLVLFHRATHSACGGAKSSAGPHYCAPDRTVYLDTGFFEDLSRRFGAPGDFAQAYVIAHEVGHHVQKLLGIADKVQELKERSDQRRANAIQVRMELQADCFAGVWANLNNQLKNRLEQGDIESGLNAASQIGDDMIQRKTTGRVVPDAFTHGSSAQRVKWFKQGLASGQIQQCDTFNAADL